MSKNKRMEVLVFPQLRDFQINLGANSLESKVYANSSNAYRGARAAMRNLLKNKNVSNESNYGTDTVAITNNNGYVIASCTGSATKRIVKNILEKTAGVKKLQIEVVI